MDISGFMYKTKHKYRDIISVMKMKLLSSMLNRYKGRSVLVEKGVIIVDEMIPKDSKAFIFNGAYTIKDVEKVCKVIIELDSEVEVFSYSEPRFISLNKNVLRIKNIKGTDLQFTFDK